MGETVNIRVGGESIAVPPLNFAALKKAWASIRALPLETELLGQAERVIEIVAAALAASRADLTLEAIEARLHPGEMLGLVRAAPDLLRLSGLLPEEAAAPGEPEAQAVLPGMT